MLKIRLIFLSAMLPISFIIIGILIGFYLNSTFISIVAAVVGLALGILLNYICAYRKLFALMLYQTPIPLTLFLLAWSISDTFLSSIFAFIVGLGALAVGLWLNKELVLPYQFYKISKRILAFLYLFLSIAMLGIFIGIPAFNLILGVLAGNYLSIRVISYARTEDQIRKNFVQGSIFTALMILALSLISGTTSLADFENIAYLFHYHFGINIEFKEFVYLFLFGSTLLGLIQFGLTFFTAKTMHAYWNYKRSSENLEAID